MRKTVGIMMVMMVAMATAVHAISVEDIMQKVKANQDKVVTLQARMITTIKSPALGRTVEQEARFYKKGPKKVRVEMVKPVQQTTIYNGEEIILIDQTGKRATMPKVPDQQDMMGKDPMDYFDKFTMSVESKDGLYVVKGIPKASFKNDSIGSVVFEVNKNNYTVTKMDVNQKDGTSLMSSAMTYVHVNSLPVLSTVQSTMNMNGQTMQVKVSYDQIKVNGKLADSLFE